MKQTLIAALLLVANVAWAQTDPQYVIKSKDNGHYLAHNGNAIQDVTSFDPQTCLWYSSNNYNYYFMDGTARKYLKAPLALNGTITVDDDPGTQMLNNNTHDYFFYDWDKGLARGIQHFGIDCSQYNSSGTQCWEVVWVSYENNHWQMSSAYGYNPTSGSARFLRETTTVHEVEISNTTGGMGNLADFSMNFGDNKPLSCVVNDFTYTTTPAHTHYHIDGLQQSSPEVTNYPEDNYYYYDNALTTTPPTSTTYSDLEANGYAWSIAGDGATYLSFDETNNNVVSSTAVNPTLYYHTQNNSPSHLTATLTLTVTFGTGASQITQTRTASVTVKTQCHNPTVLDDEKEITIVGVTVSWLPSATEYTVLWKKQSGESTWNSATVGDVDAYTITGLEFATPYYYKVKATCDSNDPTQYSFTTLAEPGLVVTGAIFGGGRMADVKGKTEVVIVNCDSIGAIFGGNDIAGTVEGNDGSTITLGVDAGGTYASYGTTPNNGKVRVSSVYGGGNGYYAYNGSSFSPATANTYTVSTGGSVTALSETNQWNNPVWTNTGAAETLTLPSIKKTTVEVTNNWVKVDSIFGGAKNAYLYTNAGSSITIDGGTVFAVFGGNNVGGGQGYGWHNVTVNGTTTNLTSNITNTATTGYGRDFGIRYLFGGGNMVYGSTTNVMINGGQCDTVFAGGNSADVFDAKLTVNCPMQSGSGNTWGAVYSNAIQSYSSESVTTKDNYGWDGINGIYNVRTLFGGNNQATFDSKLNGKVPAITLTSGSIGTVYGGGNAGDMWGLSNDNGSGGSLTINGDLVKYGTHVKMDSPNILIDNLYGGCQVSNVRYSTWVEINDGHVGSVYGGCNVSGDVGSTMEDPDAPSHLGEDPNEAYQKVFGGTYVVASGGTVYKNLFAGGNGFYHCVSSTGYYSDGLNYTNHNYVGMAAPTHNETHVVVNTGATVKGNVYAGGNLACVGFDNSTVGTNPFPTFVGLASVRMSGGTVNGSVYGGGNMADVFGSNEVQVSGGTIDKSLYGGNDRMGKVAQISNRVLPTSYSTASDDATSLLEPKVYTYVSLTGNPSITNVYGGGNGDYVYFDDPDDAASYSGDKETVVSCDITNQPIQRATFVDVGIDGGASGGHIGTVYGGGDGVTVTEFLKVFLNVKNNQIGYSNVGTIFGGNNKGDLELVSDIILLNGQVNTVYGGCNQGAMVANSSQTLKTIGGYENIGSYVRLLASYDPDGDGSATAVTPNVKIMDAVYGGCRMNGVTNNSLVLVDGLDYSTPKLFGGCDISGTVGGTSRVAVANGTVSNAFGGGNGDYNYETGDYAGLELPSSTISCVDMLNGTANNLYGGGNACGSGATQVNVSGGTVNTGVYGGSNAQGTITGDVVVNITGGTIGVSTAARANVHGGGYGPATETAGNVTVNIATNGAAAGPTINGDIYGGSALGQVSAADKTTQVNFYKGIINGDVYGGGLGNNDHAAEVSGDVEINIHGGVFNSATGTAGGGNIFGCNNANGSPQGDVTVNIYATDHTGTNTYPSETITTVGQLNTNAATQAYAINQVFGGGNLAAYKPAAVGEGETPHSTTVHVYNCDNTINTVFGGGNAADVGVKENGTITQRNDTYVIIEGGRIHRVIGGGNGESGTAANIFGTANTTIYAGLIDEVFGGANMTGDVDAINLTMSNPGNSPLNNTSLAGCTAQVYGKVFGCANAADYNRSVTTNILCGVGEIGELYGGSNLANIGTQGQNNADVTLNLYGGEHVRVFAGSKGDLASLTTPGTHTDKASNIYGNVTLNLYGGKVTDAFGGSNYNGDIAGTITVNVLDVEDANCNEKLDLTNVYGGSNLADYRPSDGTTTVSPVVNVIHIAQTDGIRGNVFGGGNQAAVYASPQVNIGYVSSMSGVIPQGYPIAEANRRAYVSGNVFGGGNEAGVTGNPVINLNNGDVVTDVYGGCHTNGTVTGNITVNANGGTVGQDVFGGGKGNATATNGNITVIVDGATIRDVYGGSALGQVNNANTQLTKTQLKSGTITGNLYGGGMGKEGTSYAAYGQVNGQVEVHVNGGEVGNVFGCNNTNGQPISTVKVYVNETTSGTMTINGNVYGGGNVAYYEGTPEVFIQNGTIGQTSKVFGGGNNIATANKGVVGSHVEMTGGTVLGGIYGGCNTDGDVTGNVLVNILGGTVGATGNGNEGNIHGGGFGQLTTVAGNVTVNFGEININAGEEVHNNEPVLYGAVYGGSALGSVNASASNTTQVNILNGEIHGNVYGGGLGSKISLGDDTDVAAVVNGVVEVNIGKCTVTNPGTASETVTLNGMASLIGSSVFGCNNKNGSPQDSVVVNIYKTNHIAKDLVSYTENDATYAIGSVFGGGNRANYEPVDYNNYSAYTPTGSHRTCVYIHGCDNTIEYVYGGGNAADAFGVITLVEGGRFNEMFGGGNGLTYAANIGYGGVHYNRLSGHVKCFFEGSNRMGVNYSETFTSDFPFPATGVIRDCSDEGFMVDAYFCGSNQAEKYDGVDQTITCADADKYHYKYLYAGSRWAAIYGDVNLTIEGGQFENVFGGSKGYNDANGVASADIKKYPTLEEIQNANPGDYPQELITYLESHTDQYGKGGNINLIIKGGTIGDVFGGCDILGNVEGKITITIDSTNSSCGFFVGNVYGASNLTFYTPTQNSGADSPEVNVLQGTIGGTTNDFGNTNKTFDGNVFGGGNFGDVTSNPKVIIGDPDHPNNKIRIKGKVYGGGNEGDVNGNARVIVGVEN